MRRALAFVCVLLSCAVGRAAKAQDFPIDNEVREAVVPPLAPGVVPDAVKPRELAAQTEEPQSFGIDPERRVGVAATPLMLLGVPTPPGVRRELQWSMGENFTGTTSTVPIFVLNGSVGGPRVCLTAAIHGDELNGVEIVRRVSNEIDLAGLSGSVIAVPIVNLSGFTRNSRYLPDRRDLNRYFPGRETGSIAARMAFRFFNDVIVHCDALIDFHTGSFERSNLPQVRGDLTLPAVREFTRAFGATAVLHSMGSTGMLRRAAVERDIPAVTFEVGAPMQLEPDQIDAGVQAVHAVLHKLGMTRSFRVWGEPQAYFYRSKWVRANSGGMLFAEVDLGDRVRVGQRLGKIVDPIKNTEAVIESPVKGRVIGKALNQIVLPGYAAFHIGVDTSVEGAAIDASKSTADPMDAMEDDELSPRMIREDRDAESEMPSDPEPVLPGFSPVPERD